MVSNRAGSYLSRTRGTQARLRRSPPKGNLNGLSLAEKHLVGPVVGTPPYAATVTSNRYLPRIAAAIALLLAIALVGGCGGGGKSGAKKPAKSETPSRTEAQVIEDLSNYFSSSSTALAPSDSTCIATALVTKTGIKALTTAGILDKDGKVNPAGGVTFTPELAGTYADAFLGCVNYAVLAAKNFVKSNPKLSLPKLTACLKKQLPNTFMRRVIVASQSADAATNKDLAAANKRIKNCQKTSKKK